MKRLKTCRLVLRDITHVAAYLLTDRAKAAGRWLRPRLPLP